VELQQQRLAGMPGAPGPPHCDAVGGRWCEGRDVVWPRTRWVHVTGATSAGRRASGGGNAIRLAGTGRGEEQTLERLAMRALEAGAAIDDEEAIRLVAADGIEDVG
jgi:hypothetical protein